MMRMVLAVTLTAFVLGAAGLERASRRAHSAMRRERRVKLFAYFVVVHAVLLAAFLGRVSLTALLSLVVVAGALELRRAVQRADALRRWAAGAIYTTLSAGLIAFAFASSPAQAVYVYLIVAAFDGFSQVAGQLFGATPLAPGISPRKTVEGFLGGAVVACVLAVLLRRVAGLAVADAITTGAILVAASLTGDLCASWLKRACGIKDFGALIPGHGGVLDRFDSLLFAAPVAFLLGL